MKLDIALTFLELGDATSRNLGFAHRDDVYVSYGEETITETNLLEIRRRHSELVRIRTFPKQREAKNGADWEWHVVGRRRTLKMRVQAKRLQCDDKLKVRHKVKSSGREQRDLLIAGARAARMKAVYCIYCSELQRKVAPTATVTIAPRTKPPALAAANRPAPGAYRRRTSQCARTKAASPTAAGTAGGSG